MFTMALEHLPSTLLFHGSYGYQAENPRWTILNCSLLEVFGDTPWKMNGWKLNITLVWKVKSSEPKRHEVGFQPWFFFGGWNNPTYIQVNIEPESSVCMTWPLDPLFAYLKKKQTHLSLGSHWLGCLGLFFWMKKSEHVLTWSLQIHFLWVLT